MNNSIYQHKIKPYKQKRLFYSEYFRALYKGEVEPKITLNQYLFRIATHCWLQRLNEQDICTVFAWWSTKHQFTLNWWYVRNVVLPETYRNTRATLKAQRKAENERAKARRLGKVNDAGSVR